MAILRRRTAATERALLLKKLVAEVGIERVTPHDLRRTCLTAITRLGFGRDAMDRIANHKTFTTATATRRKTLRFLGAVARHVIGLVEAEQTSNVVVLR